MDVELKKLQLLLEEKNNEIKCLKEELLKRTRSYNIKTYDLNVSSDYDSNIESLKRDLLENLKNKSIYKSGCNCDCHLQAQIIPVYNDAETQTFETDFINEALFGSTEDWKPPEGTNLTVTDLVKEVAEEHYGQTDYVYDEVSKMYYSPSTGYYYDQENELLYDPQSGAYYKYDSIKNTYEFYCQATATDSMNQSATDAPDKMQINGLKSHSTVSNRKMKRRRRKRCEVKSLQLSEVRQEQNSSSTESTDSGDVKIPSEKEISSLEEGEIYSASSDSTFFDSSEEKPYGSSPDVTFEEESLEKWPPCIRAIVKDSTELQIGSLLLITCTGGVIGRDKMNSIYIPDLTVSKVHAEISFNPESWQFHIKDLGSQNGTFVNDVRLSEPKEQSSPFMINHGDYLNLGSFRLLLHIHNDGDTCDNCEPGQIQAELAYEEGKSNCIVKSKEEKEKERRQQLKQIKKKFGLQDMSYVDGGNTVFSKNCNYQDRAKERRKTKGSQNPYEKDAPPATLDTALPSSNKGYQMLEKMGWAKGQKLGSNKSGILEPIPVHIRDEKAGLGAPEKGIKPVREDPRRKRWRKAQKRYHQLEKKLSTCAETEHIDPP